ncbi:MFS transporter [Dongia deserti]|uniref:MFS transporter n=1 Tax=Dongia deserti TaxID=2268030 RepID=UPI00254852A2|nr:MFS transporter [Dongia deserti]
MTARASPLTPFKYHIFLALWLASLFSNFGGLIQSVGASWLMTSLSPTADVVALVQASTVLPYMLFCLAAGAAADVFDRRALMLAAQILALVVSALLTAFTFAGVMTPWLLLTFTFLVGCGNAIYGPAWQSSVGEVVPRTELPAAVALNSLGFNLARTVGPAIGGLIVATFGSQAAFLINSISYIGLIAVLFSWKRPVERRLFPPETIPAAMMAGLRYVALSPTIRSVLIRATVFGLAASSIWALMPLIARDLIKGGPSTYGLLLGAFGVGAVLSALSSTRLRARFGSGHIVTVATLSFAVGSILAAFSTTLPITMFAMVLGGAGWVLALSTFNISVQLSVPRWVVGRSVAIYQTATFGGMALGSWLWGLAAHHFGLVFSLAAAGGVLVASMLLSRVWPVPSGSGEDLDPRAPDTTPTLNQAIPHRAGQVVVTIEYLVALADAPHFANAMRKLAQARQRNGARRWSLMVDVTDPELWVERFQYPSWVDYLRQRYRGTVGDRAIWEHARTFHRGDAPPRVRRLIAQPVEHIAAAPSAERERVPAIAITDPALPPDPSTATESSTSDSPTETPSGRTR